MDELDFNIPEQNRDAAELDPKPKPANIAQWLDKLPLVNPEHSIRLLGGYLAKLNQCKLAYSDRFKAMELLRPTCTNLVISLRNKYSHATLPLSDKNTHFYNSSIMLNTLMCIGYKSIINDTEINNISANNEKIIIYSVYHTIQQLSYIMLECYIVYRPVPINTWREMHPLFKMADEQGFFDTLIPLNPDSLTETIAISYKRSILLALANPYHLMQDEAFTVFKMLSKLSQGLLIKPYPKNEVLETGFAIDLKSDHSPVFLSANRKINLFDPRVLNMNRLVDALGSHIVKLDNEISKKISSNQSSLGIRLKHDLLLRIYDSWSRSRERLEAREVTLGHKDVIIGLSTTHYHVSNKQPFKPEIDEISNYASDILESPGTGLGLIPKEYEPWKSDEAEQRLDAGIDQPRSSNFDTEGSALDTWEKIYSAKSSREHDEISQAPEQNEKHNLSSWEIKNQSRAGLSLFCQADRCLPVRVGELMSYRDNETWVLGTIRWLHANDNNTIELGIMVISDTCKPVATRAVSGIGKGGEYMRSLLIDMNNLKHEDAKLILPAAIYHTNTELVVNVGGTLNYVELTEPVISTKSLNVFKFKLIAMPDIESRNIEAMQQLLE
ncbi:MAG: hypothetical protein GXP13_04020 [Gammaproteobacteria bacterium]|nr:hypothetical protein [Gammaproteobacteria bacterium]